MDRLETSFALYSRYFYPPALVSVSLNSTFHWIHSSAVTMGDSRHHVLSLIQSKSTIEADQPVTVGSVFMWANQCIHQRHAETTNQAAPTFSLFKSTTGQSSHSFTRMHPRSRMNTFTHACISSLPYQKRNIPVYLSIMATVNKNLKPNNSTQVFITIHTKACEYIQLQNQPGSPLAIHIKQINVKEKN